MDVVYMKEAGGTTHDYVTMVDEGTGYVVVAWTPGHSAADLSKVVLDYWISWAGPPDFVYADAERSFCFPPKLLRLRSAKPVRSTFPRRPTHPGKKEKSSE